MLNVAAALQVAGLVVLSVAAFLVSTVLGLFVLGAALLLVGIAQEVR